MPEETFDFQESEAPQDNIGIVKSGLEEESFNFNQRPLEVSVECEDNKPPAIEVNEAKPESNA